MRRNAQGSRLHHQEVVETESETEKALRKEGFRRIYRKNAAQWLSGQYRRTPRLRFDRHRDRMRDVYKRQALASVLPAAAAWSEPAPAPGAAALGLRPSPVAFIKPVSYTHLDVYKRQPRSIAARIAYGKPGGLSV